MVKCHITNLFNNQLGVTNLDNKIRSPQELLKDQRCLIHLEELKQKKIRLAAVAVYSSLLNK